MNTHKIFPQTKPLWSFVTCLTVTLMSFLFQGMIYTNFNSILPSADNLPLAANSHTVVLASPDDLYYDLAQEIAKWETLPLVNTLDDALNLHPKFLIWVTSPTNLSDEIIVQTSLAIKNLQSVPSIGVISGATIQDARELYHRGKTKPEQRYAIVNMDVSTSGVKSEIIIFEKNQEARLPLTKSNLLKTLQTVGYFTEHLHGSPSAWVYEEDGKIVRIQSSEIPKLNNTVIIAHSCDNFRPWAENSFVLTSVHKGALAYVGFPYKPNTGQIFGEFSSLNYRFTWDDFPIGHVVQIQNHAALQGYANFPYFYLLGDPRISFQTQAPYQVAEDIQSDDAKHRYLKIEQAEIGMLPVRIPGGAKYEFVVIPGVSASGINDMFFNNRLQMIDINEDKYILFKNTNSEFSIYLEDKPCHGWLASDFLSDVLDAGILFMLNDGVSLFFVVGCIVSTLTISISMIRKTLTLRLVIPSLLSGLLVTGLLGVYVFFRADKVTIVEKSLVLNSLIFINSFLFITSGSLIYLAVKNIFSKLIAVLLANLPLLGSTVISFIGLWISNNYHYAPMLGERLYNYKLPIMCFCTLLLGCVIVFFCFLITERILKIEP